MDKKNMSINCINLYRSEIKAILKELNLDSSNENVERLIEKGLGERVENAIMENGYWEIVKTVIKAMDQK